MNINILRRFRHDISGCFLRAKDALMTETQAKSLPEITQSLWFERHWSSVYEALEDGRIAQDDVRNVFVHYLPKPTRDNWLWIGVDTSVITRPNSLTAQDRTALTVHNLPTRNTAISYGWLYWLLGISIQK